MSNPPISMVGSTPSVGSKLEEAVNLYVNMKRAINQGRHFTVIKYDDKWIGRSEERGFFQSILYFLGIGQEKEIERETTRSLYDRVIREMNTLSVNNVHDYDSFKRIAEKVSEINNRITLNELNDKLIQKEIELFQSFYINKMSDTLKITNRHDPRPNLVELRQGLNDLRTLETHLVEFKDRIKAKLGEEVSEKLFRSKQNEIEKQKEFIKESIRDSINKKNLFLLAEDLEAAISKDQDRDMETMSDTQLQSLFDKIEKYLNLRDTINLSLRNGDRIYFTDLSERIAQAIQTSYRNKIATLSEQIDSLTSSITPFETTHSSSLEEQISGQSYKNLKKALSRLTQQIWPEEMVFKRNFNRQGVLNAVLEKLIGKKSEIRKKNRDNLMDPGHQKIAFRQMIRNKRKELEECEPEQSAGDKIVKGVKKAVGRDAFEKGLKENCKNVFIELDLVIKQIIRRQTICKELLDVESAHRKAKRQEKRFKTLLTKHNIHID